MRTCDVFFDLRLNKRLSKQSVGWWFGWWFETPSRSLWRHCDEISLTTWQCTRRLAPAIPIYNISIEFEILPKFAMLWYKMYSTDHNEILYTSRQCNCRDVCKISMWSLEHILNYSTPNFDRISNSIEIPLVGRAPGGRHVPFDERIPLLPDSWHCPRALSLSATNLA